VESSILDLKQATVLITGGTQGIGLGLAERFLAAGSTVIITGRNAEGIEQLTQSSPRLFGLVSDISRPEDRAIRTALAGPGETHGCGA
jgi:uncharacterized oxidoreductase